MNPYRNHKLRELFESISPEENERQTRKQNEVNEAMYLEFIAAMNRGICFLCKCPNDSFYPAKFCLHWFLYPKGIKKRHFSKHLNGPLSFFRIDAYFRWLANSETPILNINDLSDEKSQTSYVETTMKYKNLEWSFSIGNSDKEGHKLSKIATQPHYHLQMKVEDRIFLRFNDFHIQFTDEDLFIMEAREQLGDMFEAKAYRGEGIGIIENEEMLKYLADNMTVAEDERTAPFRRQTLIEAPEGQKISGDLIADAAEESKRTKEPVGQNTETNAP